MQSSVRVLGIIAVLACTACLPIAAQAESPLPYLKLCEQRRIDTIFSLRGHISDDASLAALPKPMTDAETKAREELIVRNDWLKARLAKFEDFNRTVFNPIDADHFSDPNAGKISEFGVFERHTSPDSKLILVVNKVVDRQHVLLDVFQLDKAAGTPKKWKHQILLAMPTAKLKVDDKVEPTGVYECRVVMRPSRQRGGEPQPTDVVAATPVNLRSHEKVMAEYRKQAKAEFLVREKEWLRERERAKKAAQP
jgi:hypothetical protein